MLVGRCPICGLFIQDDDKAVMFEDSLGRVKQLAHEDCYTDSAFAERAEDDKQAAFDSSRGVGR